MGEGEGSPGGRRLPIISYLGLDTVEATEPKDLATTEFPLSMVNFLLILRHFLISDVILPGAMPCLLQAFQVAGGDGGNDLQKGAGVNISTFSQ